MINSIRRPSQGFALPVILMTCLALMIVILSSMSAASSLRASIDDQYYNRLADEAAQSGVTYAISCLSQNAYSQTWASPLTQTKNCAGDAMTPAVTITGQPNTRTTFEVGDLEGASDGAVMVTSTGRVERLVEGTSTSAKTYTSTVKRIANSAYIKFNGVKFGYYFYGPYLGATGVYYFVKGTDGKLRAAGSNDYGQLGNGTTNSAITPTEVIMPPGKKPASVYTNFVSQGWSTYVGMTDGSIWGAGWNSYGQLGNGATSVTTKTLQEYKLPPGEQGEYVGPLGFATFVIAKSGNVYAAGNCSNGELGIGESCTGNEDYVSNPTKVVGLPTPTADPATHPADDIVADSRTVYVRMNSGKIYGWGGNYQAQLCNGSQGEVHSAQQVGTFGNAGQPKAKSIAFDGVTLYVIDTNGDLWSCGHNYYGQAGINSTDEFIKSFRKVNIPASAGRVTKVHTDQFYFIALTSSGQVWGAGHNKAGQLGDGSRLQRNNPVQFNLPNGVSGIDIYETSHGDDDDSHYNNAFVVGNNGRVYGAGGNTKGQLGNSGNQEYVANPVAMDKFGPSLRAAAVVTGGGTTVILSNKGTYYTVGANQYGQLGNGGTQDTNSPEPAKFLKPASGAFVF